MLEFVPNTSGSVMPNQQYYESVQLTYGSLSFYLHLYLYKRKILQK
jgi:hypothetical protein